MKPIIIIKEKNANGKFELTEQELKGLIEQAYAQGVEDGKPPKKPLPQNQYDRPEEGILHRNIIHDVYGNPYCVSTESDPKDNIAVLTLNTEHNDLVNRIREHNDKLSKQGAIPCYDTAVTCGTTSQNTLT